MSSPTLPTTVSSPGSSASSRPRAKRAPPPPPERRRLSPGNGESARACARADKRKPVPQDRRPCPRRARARESGRRERRVCAKPVGASRARRRGEERRIGNESAFVVPSAASTSASPALPRDAAHRAAAAGEIGVDDEGVPSARASPAATAAPSPFTGVVDPSPPARHDRAGSSVTTSTRPTSSAASTTSPSIATASAARIGGRDAPLRVSAVRDDDRRHAAKVTRRSTMPFAPGPDVAHSRTSNQCVPRSASATSVSVWPGLKTWCSRSQQISTSPSDARRRCARAPRREAAPRRRCSA